MKIFFALLFLNCSYPMMMQAEEKTTVNKLPKVLIIGDSISLGYTPYVKKMLKAKAFVTHHKGNAQHTGTGLKKIDKWIGKTKWNVIHFNWGLWDLCYRHPDSKVPGQRDKLNGKLTTTPKQYEKNLEDLVTRLEKTGATLIWAHTTVVPDKEEGRIVGDDIKYNKIATKIMKKHKVTINDLQRLTAKFSPKLFVASGNVHYTKKGSKKIAIQVVKSIEIALKSE